MPVTYIDPRARREWEGALELALARTGSRPFAPAHRAGQQVVEVRADVEAGIAQVAIDPAVDDAHHGRHLADVAADQSRQVAAAHRREVVPQRCRGSASSSVARAARRRRGRACGPGRIRVEDPRRHSARRTPPPAARDACGRRPPSYRCRPSPVAPAATSATISWHNGQPKCRRKTSSSGPRAASDASVSPLGGAHREQGRRSGMDGDMMSQRSSHGRSQECTPVGQARTVCRPTWSVQVDRSVRLGDKSPQESSGAVRALHLHELARSQRAPRMTRGA